MTTIIAPSHLGTAYPLDHPRICYDVVAATYVASNSAPGADPAWLGDGETWSIWKADASTVTVGLSFSGATDISYLGLAAHTLDLAGSTIDVEFNTGSGFVPSGLPSVTPEDDSAILWLFDPIAVEDVRLLITGTDAPQIAVAQAGLAMELPRQATYTGLPISESNQITYRNSKAVRGGILNRVVQGAELAFDMEVANLSEEWRRGDDWQGFVDHVTDGKPFFVAPRPNKYPEDLAFASATDRPRFNRGIANHRVSGSFSLQCVGYKRP